MEHIYINGEPVEWSEALAAKMAECQTIMNHSIAECLYGDHGYTPPTRKQNIIGFFVEVKTRISNAYDVLVKGVDPYEY